MVPTRRRYTGRVSSGSSATPFHRPRRSPNARTAAYSPPGFVAEPPPCFGAGDRLIAGGARPASGASRPAALWHAYGMVALELTRTSEDRHLHALGGIGTLRLNGFVSRAATAEAGGRTWQFSGRGFWRRRVIANDAVGSTVGEFKPRGFRRGGTVRWGGRELTLRPASNWHERYALADGENELVLLDDKGWGTRPVKVTVEEPDVVEPGLLLFAVFVVRGLAEDATAAAGGPQQRLPAPEPGGARPTFTSPPGSRKSHRPVSDACDRL